MVARNGSLVSRGSSRVSRTRSLVSRSRFLRTRSDSVLTRWSSLVTPVDAEVSERCSFKTHSGSESGESVSLRTQSVSRSTRRRSQSRQRRSLWIESGFQSTQSDCLSTSRRCEELEGPAGLVWVGSVALRAFYPWGPPARGDPVKRNFQDFSSTSRRRVQYAQEADAVATQKQQQTVCRYVARAPAPRRGDGALVLLRHHVTALAGGPAAAARIRGGTRTALD